MRILNEINAFIKEVEDGPLSLPAHENLMRSLWSIRELWCEEHGGNLISDPPTPKNVKNTFLLFISLPVTGILFKQSFF